VIIGSIGVVADVVVDYIDDVAIVSSIVVAVIIITVRDSHTPLPHQSHPTPLITTRNNNLPTFPPYHLSS